MNKILTAPKEIEDNERVLYADNHYISMPEISTSDAPFQTAYGQRQSQHLTYIDGDGLK